MDRITVYAMFLRALEAGGRQNTPFEVEWDISGNCLMPVRREIHARQEQKLRIQKRAQSFKSLDDVEETFHSDFWSDKLFTHEYGKLLGPYAVLLTARCRMCDNCLKVRRNQWAEKAKAEFAASSRTWFITMTLSPQWHEHFANIAREKSRHRLREVFEALPLDVQFRLRHEAIAAELTKAFKRLRKKGHAFRYFLVAEAHKSGLPHYHLLLHETGAPIGKRVLEAAWPFGFVKPKLATDEKVVWYVAKYLGKSGAARIRASIRYGLCSLSESSEKENDRVIAENKNFEREKGLTSERILKTFLRTQCASE